ncbi:MAG: ADP-ribosylation factor family-domain-containing protein [Linnemannia elongata]|nr:MAG: ADP-ribosylation factor family-domain-containing protein [Linnemannia elongata]
MDSLLSSSSNADQNTDEDKDKDPSNNTASLSSSFDTATTNTPKEQHDEHQEEQEPPQSDTKNIKLLLYDLSGSSRFRSHYPPYVKQTHAIIYVLDASAPHARFEESRRFLCEILEEWNPDSYKIPLLVYANKMDSLQARRIEEIRDRLALGRGVELGWGAEAAEIAVVGGGGGGGIVNKRRVWRLQGASAATGEGLMEGIDWLVVQLEVQRCEEHREEDARQRG